MASLEPVAPWTGPAAFDVDELPPAGGVLPEVARSWQIDGIGSAEWAMSRVAQAERALEDLTTQATEFYARIDEWLRNESARHRATKAFFEAHLERWALAQREADPRRKTIALPSGKVKTTAKGPSVQIEDARAALEWAKAHLVAAVAMDPRLKVSVLKEHVQVVELVTRARFTHSCGCVYDVLDPEGLTWPEIGSEVECVDHAAPSLLGKVDVLASRLALSVDVPGVVVDEGGVTAQVVPR